MVGFLPSRAKISALTALCGGHGGGEDVPDGGGENPPGLGPELHGGDVVVLQVAGTNALGQTKQIAPLFMLFRGQGQSQWANMFPRVKLSRSNLALVLPQLQKSGAR